MNNSLRLTVITLLLAVPDLSAATLYVSLGSTNPTPPYTNWATAAHTIQQAVDAADDYDEVVVTNGVYGGGLEVNKPLALWSVNGSGATIINGGYANGCVYLTDDASLSGFTLTNGWVGVWCASENAYVDNCLIINNITASDGGGAYGCTLYNCTLSGNRALNGSGGGAYGSALYDCTLVNNSAPFGGGGAYGCTLFNCTLNFNGCLSGEGNSIYGGGGAYECTLYNCTLFANQAGANNALGFGGGAYGGTLNNCTLSQNAANYGGGAYGGTLHSCTLSENVVAIESYMTIGYGSGGGAYAGTLYNCTLTGNKAELSSGGGAYGSTLYNCTLNGNSAPNYSGGGAYGSILYNCKLTGNSCSDYGGGAYQGTLYNCTLSGNSTTSDNWYVRGSGGGAYQALLYNCIVYYNSNTAAGGTNYDAASTLNYCCTTPLPNNGLGNITNAPLFIDYTNANLRLQSNSPCINAGNNSYMTNSTDLDGRPRIVGGTVDIGAYEFQPGVSGAFIGWLQQYGLPTDGSADFADPDNDGMNNWQEWVCGTDPTNPLSALRMVSAMSTSTNARVTWQSVTGVNYVLERSADLGSAFTSVATNIIGQAGTTTYADTNATGAGPFFYRVGVKSP